jgi:hypothetical protein
MRRKLTVLLLCLWAWSPSWAQEGMMRTTVSPKLRQFLADHQDATKILTNAISEIFSNRTVGVYYFYSYDETKPRAYHYYPNVVSEPQVVICVRENQEPVDEYITLIFEMVNSTGEKRFAKLCDDARAGRVPKKEFAREILKIEFETIQGTRERVMALKIGGKETIESFCYKRYLECPNKFEDFLSAMEKDPGSPNPLKEYEAQYDAMRKMQ